MPSSLRFSARYISVVHTICASTAFLSALLIGLRLHYRKIVKNDVAGYPDEWWPSVSATYVPKFAFAAHSHCQSRVLTLYLKVSVIGIQNGGQQPNCYHFEPIVTLSASASFRS